MKKGNIFLISVILCCMVVSVVIAYGVVDMVLGSNDAEKVEEFDALVNTNTISMSDLMYKIDTSSFVGQVRIDEGEVELKLNDTQDIITISLESKKINYLNKLTLKDDVLTAMYYNDIEKDNITFQILDIVYGMYSSSESKIKEYVLNTDASLYGLEDVGLACQNGELSIKIGKELDYIDFKKVFISVYDAAEYAEELQKEKLTVISNSNVMALKTGMNGEIIISVAEYEDITLAAYDSLMNVLAVTLNYNEFYQEFLNSHSYYKLKNEKTQQYSLEINPIKETYEQNNFGDRPMIRLTIFAK